MSLDQWPLFLGAVLCFGALLLALLKVTLDRTPRAKGMLRSHATGLASVAQRAEAVTDNVLQRGGQTSIIGGALEQAGLDLRPGEFMVVVCAAALVALTFGWILVGPFFGLLITLFVLVGSKVGVGFLGGRRRKQFTDQLVETLQLLTGSLRAGNGLTQAMDTVARESESPTADEFRRLVVETRLGRDLTDSLRGLSDRMGSQDLLWVVQAIDINREIGGNLAEVLDTITGTIRDRNRLRRQVSALTAEGRLSAAVVMFLPFALVAVMAVMNPTYLHPLYATTGGLLALAAGGALLAVGGLWLRQLVRPVF
jgi:tight adherence protein B